MLSLLDRLEAESIVLLREAKARGLKLVMLWSCGKDSNVMIHLARKAFLGSVPFPVLHCDTGLEFDEVYQFRARYQKEWNLELLAPICPPLEATDPSLPPAARIAARKTLGLSAAMKQGGFNAVIAGIRRDEEATRAKERLVSRRDQDGSWHIKEQPPEFWGHHNWQPPEGGSLRIHPLLGWTEIDIWRYIQREGIPTPNLYFAAPYHHVEGRDFSGRMMRFRSLGERGITWPIESDASGIPAIIAELMVTTKAERAGRPMGSDEDETAFERLREGGYM
ncbi:MAG: sulfate adenylyltransferase subunit CysD [Rickettsiales bacterium]|jgi:sulfate adenylyltransferase subunit 2|nr:sulfate adenylyltransferase subunit CysD [Rickettsiales bacterium]